MPGHTCEGLEVNGVRVLDGEIISEDQDASVRGLILGEGRAEKRQKEESEKSETPAVSRHRCEEEEEEVEFVLCVSSHLLSPFFSLGRETTYSDRT